MPIKVWNSKDRPVYLKSFDGDSVFIAAKAKGIEVANKFGWQVPDFIKVSEPVEESICPSTIVRGRIPIPARKPPRSHNPSGQPAPDNTRTAKQIREFALQAKDQREADKQREALNNASAQSKASKA
jgi:hypothetical protein